MIFTRRTLLHTTLFGLITFCSACFWSEPAPEPPPTPVKHPAPLRTESVAKKMPKKGQEAYDREAFVKKAQEAGTLETTTISIPSDSVSAAAVLIGMKRGVLTMASGSGQLATASLEYDTDQAIPLVSYRTNARMRVVDLLGLGSDNAWDINLSQNVPTAVKIESLGGLRDLNFEDVPLTELSVKANSGATLATVPGDNPYLNAVEINQRDGSISFTADGMYESLLKVETKTSNGDVYANLTGFYSRLTRVDISSLDGDLEVDLTGRWDKDCVVRLEATCGNVRLRVPAGLGTSVKVNNSCASICTVGLHKTWSSNTFINPAYAKSDVNLEIIIDSTCGNVDVVLEGCCCPWWIW